jgi:hypothetical protein
MFIGILIGIAIVFNWSGIKRFFDGGVASGSSNPPAAAAVAPPAATSTAPVPVPAPDAHGDLSRATEQRLRDIAAGK